MNKNHEGYADFTACEAVRRADKARKHNRGVYSLPGLTYRLEECGSFREAIKQMFR